MNWKALINALLPLEQAVVPVFVHNPQSGNIAAVILAVEAVVPDIVAAATSKATPPATPPSPTPQTPAP